MTAWLRTLAITALVMGALESLAEGQRLEKETRWLMRLVLLAALLTPWAGWLQEIGG